jgi:hypothetical protein
MLRLKADCLIPFSSEKWDKKYPVNPVKKVYPKGAKFRCFLLE